MMFRAILFTNLFSAMLFASLTPKWGSQPIFDSPESVVYSKKHNLLFVSNVAGPGTLANAKGFISVVSPKGKLITHKWVTKLNAPKGLAVVGDSLWVADLKEIVEIDINHGKVVSRLAPNSAELLNDITTNEEGDVFVSDTFANKIFKVSKGKVEEYFSSTSLEHPNGLFMDKSRLLVASWGVGLDKSTWDTKQKGKLYSFNLETKKRTPLSNSGIGSLDGLQKDSKGNYLVTDWAGGKLYQVSPSGESTLLKADLSGAADLEYLQQQNLVIVPVMKENRLEAFTWVP